MNKYQRQLKDKLKDLSNELRLIKQEIRFSQRHELPIRHAKAVRKQKDLTEAFNFYILTKFMYQSYRTKMYLLKKSRIINEQIKNKQ